VDCDWSSGYYQWRSFAWDYSIANTTYYGWIYGNLTIKTTISTDFKENLVEMDTSTKVALFVFDFDLEGTDNPDIDIELTDIPSGFTANTTSISQKLQDRVHFKITDTGTAEYAGIYYFEMNVTLDSDDSCVYYERIPFIIPVVESYSIIQPSVLFEEENSFGEEGFAGNVTATFDFLDDTVGESPIGWHIGESGGSVEISTGYQMGGPGREMVVCLTDTSSMNNVYMWDGVSVSNGTIEYWISFNDVNKKYSLQIQDGGGSNCIDFYVDEGYFKYRYGVLNPIISECNLGWYHIKISFDCSTDWHLWINGISMDEGEGYSYFGSPSTMDTVYFATDASDSSYKFYVDDVGYSWDSEYIIGDNLYETIIPFKVDPEVQVSKGDVVVLDFRTNSMNSIDLILKNNDIVQNIYNIMPSGYRNEMIRSSKFMVNETFTFDEIEIEIENDGYRWFELGKIYGISTTETVGEEFNPVNITNNGNYPLFFSFDISGVEADATGGGGICQKRSWSGARSQC